MKKSFVILGICIGLCFVCIGIYIYTVGPLNPTRVARDQENNKIKNKLDNLCSDQSINQTMRNDFICKLPTFVDGCAGKDSSACNGYYYTYNEINPSFNKIGIDGEFQIFNRGANTCLGNCGGDGGHYENLAFAYKDKFIGYSRIFTKWKNTNKVLWKQLNNEIYFYLYDESLIGSNVPFGNVLFKYNIDSNEFYSSVIEEGIADIKIDKLEFDDKFNIEVTQGERKKTLTFTNFKLQLKDHDSMSNKGFLFNTDSLINNK